jgi:Ulp1 family protease
MLSTEGVKSIIDWTTNRDIDVFFKKMVLVPIHKDQHWSLAVVINAGLVDFCNEENEPSKIPCILHMDGLSLHDRKGIAANIRIRVELKSINVNIFTILTMYSFSVPGKPSFCSTHVLYYSVFSLSNNKTCISFFHSLKRKIILTVVFTFANLLHIFYNIAISHSPMTSFETKNHF